MSKLESSIQRECRAIVEDEFGGKFFKWSSPGRRGVPDGIILILGLPVVFVELKKPKTGRVSGLQGHLMDWMRRNGFMVWLIDDPDQLRELLKVLREAAR